jgi:hypothetical protein
VVITDWTMMGVHLAHVTVQYFGNGAKPHLVKNGKNTIMGFRNLLGHTYDEVDHTAILTAPLIPTSETPAYTVDILIPAPVPSKTATPASRSAAASGTATPVPAPEPVPSTKTLTVPEVTTLFLSTLFTSAKDFLGVKPTACVISAPTWFTPAQHEALRDAAQKAGINILQVLDEAAAVLVGYRVGLSEERKQRGLLGSPEEGDAGETEKRDKKVVVLDMGETSLGVSVVAVSEGEYTVLGKGREDKLGGREFDNLVSVARQSRIAISQIIPKESGRSLAYALGLDGRAANSCSFSSTLPRSSPRRPRSRLTCHVASRLPTPTSVPRPSSALPLSTPSAPFLPLLALPPAPSSRSRMVSTCPPLSTGSGSTVSPRACTARSAPR